MKQSFFLRGFLAAVGVAAALSAAGCGRGNVAPVQAAGSSPAAQNSQSPAPAVVPAAPPVVLTAGTHVHVRLDQTIDTKRNRAGDPFSATLAEALVAGDRVAVPAGTPFEGHVVTSIESGRFKGRADLALSLDSLSSERRRLFGKHEHAGARQRGPQETQLALHRRRIRWWRRPRCDRRRRSWSAHRRGSRGCGGDRWRSLHRKARREPSSGIDRHIHAAFGRASRTFINRTVPGASGSPANATTAFVAVVEVAVTCPEGRARA